MLLLIALPLFPSTTYPAAPKSIVQCMTSPLSCLSELMRVIIPPLASQYLNLTKNSSLAVAIGYPDIMAMGGTVLNQTGQAIEIIAIWMAPTSLCRC